MLIMENQCAPPHFHLWWSNLALTLPFPHKTQPLRYRCHYNNKKKNRATHFATKTSNLKSIWRKGLQNIYFMTYWRPGRYDKTVIIFMLWSKTHKCSQNFSHYWIKFSFPSSCAWIYKLTTDKCLWCSTGLASSRVFNSKNVFCINRP